MSKEKVASLTKYVNDLKSRLSGTIPEKHKNRPESYKTFLKHEIEIVQSQLEAVALGSDKK